jgi:hypothetical protein
LGKHIWHSVIWSLTVSHNWQDFRFSYSFQDKMMNL